MTRLCYRASIPALVLVAALLAAPAVPAHAAGTFIALLNGGQETPPTTSNAFGVGFFTLSPDKTLCYSITYSALEASEIAAHIHGPAAPGTMAAVLFAIDAGSPKHNCTTALSKQNLKDLKKGMLYVNVHSTTSPNGEIRGQIQRMP